jgi:hypothetical protein
MADHRREAGVDLALLAAADLVDGRSHIVVNAPPRHAAQDAESVVMGVEQHLMGLLRIGPENASRDPLCLSGCASAISAMSRSGGIAAARWASCCIQCASRCAVNTVRSCSNSFMARRLRQART